MQENGTMIETMNSIPIVICQGIAQTLLRSAYMLAEFQWIAIGIQFEQKKTFLNVYSKNHGIGLKITDITNGIFRQSSTAKMKSAT